MRWRLNAAILFVALITACGSPVPVSRFCMAARNGDITTIETLISRGADVNERSGVNDWTALMHAVHKNQPSAVRALLNAGADVNARAGAHGRDTALRLAELQGLKKMASDLRARGAVELR